MSIYTTELSQKWLRIARHLTTPLSVTEYNGILTINFSPIIYIAKNSNKMRLKSHLDWVYYEPKVLAQAINSSAVDSYYEIMLTHANSDPNIWKDHNFEMLMKSYYASREQRASLL